MTCSATCSIVELFLDLDSSLKLVMYLFRPQPVMAVRVAGAFSRVPPPPGLYERMASSSTAPSTDFKRLLDRYSVSSEVANWLYSQGCLEVYHLANWVDDRSELRTAVLDKTPKKDDQAQLACLKQAWREAEAQTARSHQRAQSALPPEDLDSPLDSEEQKTLETRFRRLYNWPAVPAKQVGSDTLLGRVVREFGRRQPTQYPVSRVRTLASSQRGQPSKTRRLSASVSLSFSGGDEEDVPVNGLYSYLGLLRVLCTTWALAGAFEAEDAAGTKGLFAHWFDVTSYADAFAEKAHQELELHTEDSVVGWISSLEAEVRARAIELCRGPLQCLWGKALLTALNELTAKWGETRHLLVLRRPASLPSLPRPYPAVPLQKGSGKGTPGKGGGQTGPKGYRKWLTTSQTPAGVTICKNFNDARGCAQSCPKGYAHCCDVVLSTGVSCASRGHKRREHDPAVHGQPSVVGGKGVR